MQISRGYCSSFAIVILLSLIELANAFNCVTQTWNPHVAKLMLAPVSPTLRSSLWRNCKTFKRSLRPSDLKGKSDNKDGDSRPMPPFDLAALAGRQPENFVPADFLALHEMIVGATAKDSSVASFEMTSIGSALAEEMQKAYTNR
jgi:hypothetical protein